MNVRRNFVIGTIAALFMGCQSDGAVGTPTVVDGPASKTAASASAPSAESPVQKVSDLQGTARPVKNEDGVANPVSYTEVAGQEGVVDWTAGIVTASGIGFPSPDALNSTQARLLARRAAQAVAFRNLLEAFKAIRVDSTTTVKDHVTMSDEIQVRVTGMVEDAKVIKERELEKGGYEVTLQMRLTGRVSEVFAPKGTPPPKRIASETSSIPHPKAGSPGGPYTGLVVDARGLEIRPALIPRILTEDGQEAYSQSYVLAKYRQNQGIAAYVSDTVAAKTHPKVTDNPLFVKALRLAGESHTDLVISNAAAQTIHGVKDHFEFLEKAQVIVIIDRAASDAIMR